MPAKLDQTFIIKAQETILIDNSLLFTFIGHSHKMTYENSPPSPLLINVKYKQILPSKNDEIEKTYYMYDKEPFVWRWKNYLFVVSKYEYGDRMEMKVCLDNAEE